MKEILTVREVSEILNCTPTTVRKRIKEFKLKSFNIGGINYPVYLIRREWLLEYIENNRNILKM